MNRLDARTLDFFDRAVVSMIIEKYGMTDKDALGSFINSETYKMLCDKDTELYAFSPFVLMDMWESEKVTGNPRNSQYTR